jgi:hypothetical protein
MADPSDLSQWLNTFMGASKADRAAVLGQIAPETLGELLVEMGLAGRREALAKIGKDEQAQILARIPQDALVAMGRQGVAALGTYKARLVKRERVRGSMGQAQTLELTVRSEPFAFRLEYKSGPSSGRRALYNVEIKRDEIRIKEGGMLGIAGALWLQLDNPLTRMDTNHRATEIGFAALLGLIEADMGKAKAAGIAHSRKDEGFDGDAYCCVFTAPPGVTGLYAVSTRVGFDIASSLPIIVEAHDAHGLLETYRYSNVERASVGGDFFTLKGASL